MRKSVILLALCVGTLVLWSRSVQAGIVVTTDGAPANWERLRTSTEVLNTNAVDPRGIRAGKIRSGWHLLPLSPYDRDGHRVDWYVTWTEGRSGERVWLKVAPGESVESKPIGHRLVTVGGEPWYVYTMLGARFTVCANPTYIVWYQWLPVREKVVTKEVPGPERIIEKEVVKEVVKEIERVVYEEVEVLTYPAMPAQAIRIPRSSRYLVRYQGWSRWMVPAAAEVLARWLGRAETNLSINTSAAASSASSSSASNNNDIGIDINNQQQQEQLVDITE